MKKAGFCFLLFIIAVVVAIFIPWENVSLKNLFASGEDISSLKVYSLGGNMKVYLDGEEEGTVESQDPYLEIIPVSIGEHEVKLVRDSSQEGFYPEFKRTIKFEKGFDTVVSWEIGPTENSSSGWILFAQKIIEDKEGTLLNVTSSPEDCDILLDNEEQYTAPISELELSLDKQHVFKVTKEGYQDLEFQVFPEDQEERSSLNGYVLYLEVNLYEIPI